MKKFSKTKIILFLIILLGLSFRLYGVEWDQGYHLHPDERAIVMFTTPLQFPENLNLFLSKDSSWNPHFFAYGSFPIYLLKIIGEFFSTLNPLFRTYDEINILGRLFSGFFDIATLITLFFLGKKIFSKTVGLIAAFLYSISVLPIQLSHFYAVDTLLTFFLLQTLLQLLKLYEKPTIKKAIFVGLFFGLSLATKISAIVIMSSIGLAIIVDFLLLFIKNPHKPHIWIPHLPRFVRKLIFDFGIIAFVAFLTFAFFEPYAFLDFETFWLHNMQQAQMTRDAFTFPYTLQYVGKIPYLYELKNIFFFGLGPVISIFSFFGAFYFTYLALEKHKKDKWAKELIIAVFFWVYFLVVGSFAIGFMRYLLPLYPLLCLFAAVLIYKLFLNFKSYFLNRRSLFLLLNSLFVIIIFIWPLSFIGIYSKPNTRVEASTWINKNIPQGSRIAIEHWDDALPLFGSEKYIIETFPLYDPDTKEKWDSINKQLSETDYIIIASNRLYVPLMKMTECQKLPIGRCYTQTAEYYKKLFGGDLAFKKVAEFSTLPTLTLYTLHFTFDDSSADESFTVYDHPKIMIFKRR